jgi:hypothetical protein
MLLLKQMRKYYPDAESSEYFTGDQHCLDGRQTRVILEILKNSWTRESSVVCSQNTLPGEVLVKLPWAIEKNCTNGASVLVSEAGSLEELVQ